MIALVVLALVVLVACGWWLWRGGRDAEARRVRAIAEEAERHRREQAQSGHDAAVREADRIAADERKKPAGSVVGDFMRRGGGPLAVLLALTVPAQALDCRTVPDPAAGVPLSADQIECLRLAVVESDRLQRRCAADVAEARTERDACEATAAITCPPEPFPLVPVVVSALAGFVAAVVLLLVVPR